MKPRQKAKRHQNGNQNGARINSAAISENKRNINIAMYVNST